MVDTDKLIDRVRKLLALAGNNPNVHEAALAAERAQKLIMEHNLHIADINEESTSFSSFTQESKVDPWRRILAGAVADSMNGHVWFERSQRGKSEGKFIFSGSNDTPEAISFLFMYISEQLEALYILDYILNKSNIHGKTRRSAWFAGSVEVIINRLRKRKQNIESDPSNSKALILSKNALEKWIKDQFPDLCNAPASISPRDDDAYDRGRKAAGRINFGDSEVKGTRLLNK
jgi:hypothetical protein